MVQKEDKTMVRKVSFASEVLVYVDKTHSRESRRSMFYSTEEMDGFREDIRIQIQLADSLRFRGESAQFFDSNTYCARGLENYLDEDRLIKKRRQKLLATLAVFVEQDRQYVEEGLFSPEDFDSMAHRYHQITKQSEDDARELALCYEKLEQNSRKTAPHRVRTNSLTMICPQFEGGRLVLGPSAA